MLTAQCSPSLLTLATVGSTDANLVGCEEATLCELLVWDQLAYLANVNSSEEEERTVVPCLFFLDLLLHQ